ncbi:MAG: hypothetical protein M3Z09_00495 [Acidobacteriota bacterium]|nr:hypothetical protein [Acidobacteriota bacterium]
MKFTVAMITYAAIALIAAFWIDGTLRIAVWVLMGGLALKTVVARAAKW